MCACALRFRFCISNKLLGEVRGAGPWVTPMSRRDLEDEIRIRICIHGFRSSTSSLCHALPATPALVLCHPSGQVHCNSHILQTAFAVILSCYVFSCTHVFILLLLLERTPSQDATVINVFLTLFNSVLVVSSSLLVEHHGETLVLGVFCLFVLFLKVYLLKLGQ